MAVPVGLNIWSRLVEDTFPYFDQTVAPFDILWMPDHLQYGANKVAEQAVKELYNEDAVRGKLLELELRYDLGEIDEAEYVATEEALLERLQAIRQYLEEQQDQ